MHFLGAAFSPFLALLSLLVFVKEFEYLKRVVLLPLLLGFLDGRLFSEIDLLELLLFEQLGEGSVNEHDFPDNVANIKLHGNLLAAVGVEVGGGPVGLIVALAEEVPEFDREVVEEVEGLGGYLFVVIVDHELLGDADLVGRFGVKLHDEDEANDGADKPPPHV